MLLDQPAQFSATRVDEPAPGLFKEVLWSECGSVETESRTWVEAIATYCALARSSAKGFIRRRTMFSKIHGLSALALLVISALLLSACGGAAPTAEQTAPVEEAATPEEGGSGAGEP